MTRSYAFNRDALGRNGKSGSMAGLAPEGGPDPTSERARIRARKRTRTLWGLTVAVLTVCAVQLFNIQIVKGAEYSEQGRVVRTQASAVQAPRGSIVDASGQILVDSVPTYHIAVNQKHIVEYRHIDEEGSIVGTGPAEAARQLAPLLGRDPSELGGEFLGDSTYHYLAKNVDAATYRAIRKLGIYGIEWEPVFERLYPAGTTAATILGTIDADGKGNAGVELTFNDLLTGVPGEESYEIGPTGARIPGAKVSTKEAAAGAQVHLSIYSDLQHSIETMLDSAVDAHGADWGTVVILDVATSKVLVMADSDTKEPSRGPQASRAAQMVYEPGSVGKVLTFATALEQGIIDPYTEFTVPDSYTTHDGYTFTDIYHHEVYRRTATGIITQSLNTGTVMIGEDLKDADRFEMMTRFGLGAPTGIELPGESGGILGDPTKWSGRTRYATMFGQGYAITALQAAALVAAVANDGVWQAPRVIDGWTTSDGIYHEAERPTPDQVLRPEVAGTLLTMMESVTAEEKIGTAAHGAIEGYRIAAKTGTAEIIATGGTVANVVAALPADDPQIAVAVVLYNPQIGVKSGESAVPLFQKVAREAVRDLGIQPSKEPARLFPSIPSEE